MNLRRVAVLLIAVIFVFLRNDDVLGQTVPADFSNIKIDELSDAQIRQFLKQAESENLSEGQLEQEALARGMKAEEIRKLRNRINQLKLNDEKSLQQNAKSPALNNIDTVKSRPDTLNTADRVLAKLRSGIFGAELFSGKASTFEPNLRIATPANYQVGPDDELLIDIYGNSEASYNLKVTATGTINIPYVGVVSVGGMSIEQATARIRSRLSEIYSGLKTGNTNVRVAIGNIRSIKVVITGDIVRPGTYTIPSVSSVFNALYESGGPTDRGSFREIEVIRGGRRVSTLDIYDFLLQGEFKNNIRLQDNDVIRIPTYRIRVEMVGQVKRPAIFEMLKGESLADLLRFAGGFTERAYQARVKVLKNTTTERKISDITSDQFSAYQPSTGDKFFVDEILDRFENRVAIEGAVFRPGQYELEKGLTLKQLILKAEGLREDAFKNRGYISRLKDDLQTELISFDVAAVLSGQSSDISLKREDVVTISSLFDLKEEYRVNVEGEVRQPGKLNYSEGMTLEDAIMQSGGLKEGASSQRVEVSRRVKNSNALSTSAQTAEVFQINIEADLKSAASGFILQPFDIVVVRPSAGYEVQRRVRVDGEVVYPGIYTIVKKDERISDLIKRAGGLTAQAYTEGASLRRPGMVNDSLLTSTDTYVLKKVRSRLDSLSIINSQDQSLSDTITVNQDKQSDKNAFVGINLPRILINPNSKIDIFLEEGDILNVPRQLQTVKVGGEVLSPSTVVYLDEKGFLQYVAGAGGFSSNAKRKRSYIKYANGSVKSTRKILFFNNYPSVKPGSEIIVPQAPPKRPLGLGELVGLTSGLASVAAIIVSLLR